MRSLILLFLCISSLSAQNKKPLYKSIGSDYMNNIMVLVTEAYMKIKPEFKIQIEGSA